MTPWAGTLSAFTPVKQVSRSQLQSHASLNGSVRIWDVKCRWLEKCKHCFSLGLWEDISMENGLLCNIRQCLECNRHLCRSRLRSSLYACFNAFDCNSGSPESLSAVTARNLNGLSSKAYCFLIIQLKKEYGKTKNGTTTIMYVCM